MSDDEIPTDGDVIAAIGEDGIRSPAAVLKSLMTDGHSRAAAQRAMQRALDRNRIAFNSDLKFVVMEQCVAA